MATITLVYNIDVGHQNPANLLTRVEAVDVDPDLEMLNMTKTGDVTVFGAPGLVRTVTLETNATSDAMFPTNDNKIAATRGICTNRLRQQIPAGVEAEEPVVT